MITSVNISVNFDHFNSVNDKDLITRMVMVTLKILARIPHSFSTGLTVDFKLSKFLLIHRTFQNFRISVNICNVIETQTIIYSLLYINYNI